MVKPHNKISNHVGKKAQPKLSVTHPLKSPRLPLVLTREEIFKLIDAMSATHKLIGMLLYGGGLRLMECIRLRITDVDFKMDQIVIRPIKGGRVRTAPLPQGVKDDLCKHLGRVRLLHNEDLSRGFGKVFIPHALRPKYKDAAREWNWQYVFPSKTISRDLQTGIKRRPHIHASSFQRALKKAVRKTRITGSVTSHVFRHSCAVHLLEGGTDMRAVQKLFGHKDVSTTMVYKHVMQKEA